MPIWGPHFSVSLHPLESEHCAIGTIRESSQYTLSREHVSASVDTTHWKSAVIGITAPTFWEKWLQAPHLKVSLQVNGATSEAFVQRPARSDIGKELFPALVLQLPRRPDKLTAVIKVATSKVGSNEFTPVSFTYEITTAGCAERVSEKERYQTLSYSPSILVPDSKGHVELWKAWPVKSAPNATVPRSRVVGNGEPASSLASVATKTALDPRKSGTRSSSVVPSPFRGEGKRKRSGSMDMDIDPRQPAATQPTSSLSKKARQRLNAEARRDAASHLSSPSVAVASGGGPEGNLGKLLSANAAMQREIETLKEYEKNRQLKDELDSVRARLGLPPGDPLGLELQMSKLDFGRRTMTPEAPRRGSDAMDADDQLQQQHPSRRRRLRHASADDDHSDAKQTSSSLRRVDAARWPHDKWSGTVYDSDDGCSVTPTDRGTTVGKAPQPAINPERLRFIAEQEAAGIAAPKHPDGEDDDAEGWPAGGPCPGTGANSAVDDAATRQRRWGKAVMHEVSNPHKQQQAGQAAAGAAARDTTASAPVSSSFKYDGAESSQWDDPVPTGRSTASAQLGGRAGRPSAWPDSSSPTRASTPVTTPPRRAGVGTELATSVHSSVPRLSSSSSSGTFVVHDVDVSVSPLQNKRASIPNPQSATQPADQQKEQHDELGDDKEGMRGILNASRVGNGPSDQCGASAVETGQDKQFSGDVKLEGGRSSPVFSTADACEMKGNNHTEGDISGFGDGNTSGGTSGDSLGDTSGDTSVETAATDYETHSVSETEATKSAWTPDAHAKPEVEGEDREPGEIRAMDTAYPETENSDNMVDVESLNGVAHMTAGEDEAVDADGCESGLSVIDFATSPPTRSTSSGRKHRTLRVLRDDVGSWD